MVQATTQSPSAIKTSQPKSLTLDLKNSLKSIGKLFNPAKAETPKDVAKSSQQAEIGKSQAYSNRTGPGVNQSTTNTQSKEASAPRNNSQDLASTNSKAESTQNGKALGADLKVPGCPGGCGCGCTG